MCICLAFQCPNFDEEGIFEGETWEEGASGSIKEFIHFFWYCRHVSKAKMYNHHIRVVGRNCWILQKKKKNSFAFLSPCTVCPGVIQAVTSCNDWGLVFHCVSDCVLSVGSWRGFIGVPAQVPSLYSSSPCGSTRKYIHLQGAPSKPKLHILLGPKFRNTSLPAFILCLKFSISVWYFSYTWKHFVPRRF